MSAEFSKGWWLIAWTAATVCAALVLAVHGLTPRAMHLILCATARTSLILFLAVFVASPLLVSVGLLASALLRRLLPFRAPRVVP